jgi:drug/metabolite transporter (DMT)-like permease
LYATLLLLSLIWGGSFMFIKVLLLHQVGPWTIVFLRSSFGLVFIVLLMLLMRKPFEFRNIQWKSVILAAVVNMVLPWALIGFSETRIASSMASVLNATTPNLDDAGGARLFRGLISSDAVVWNVSGLCRNHCFAGG